MEAGKPYLEESASVQNLLWQKLRYKYITSGDLAAVALRNGMAKEVLLESLGNLLLIEGKFEHDPTYYVRGFWNVTRRRFIVRLPRVSSGYWRSGDSYVEVGPRIEVVVNNKTLISRPNICHEAESIGDRQGKHVVVHVIGTVMTGRDYFYTAFRCSEDILPLLDGPVFDRFAYDKRELYDEFDGLKVEFRELFIKKGRLVKILVNPSCEEYVSTVYRLFGTYVSCKGQ